MNSDQDLDLRVGRWLDAREVPVSGERVSERILATLATTRQERRPIFRRGPITSPTAPPAGGRGGAAHRRRPGGRDRTRRPVSVSCSCRLRLRRRRRPARRTCIRRWCARSISGPTPGRSSRRRPASGSRPTTSASRGIDPSTGLPSGSDRRRLVDVPRRVPTSGSRRARSWYSCASTRRRDASWNGSKASRGSRLPRMATRSGGSTRTATSSTSTWRPAKSSRRSRSPSSPSRSCLPPMPSGLSAMPGMPWCGSIPMPPRSPTRSMSGTDRSSSSWGSIRCGSGTGSSSLFESIPKPPK